MPVYEQRFYLLKSRGRPRAPRSCSSDGTRAPVRASGRAPASPGRPAGRVPRAPPQLRRRRRARTGTALAHDRRDAVAALVRLRRGRHQAGRRALEPERDGPAKFEKGWALPSHRNWTASSGPRTSNQGPSASALIHRIAGNCQPTRRPRRRRRQQDLQLGPRQDRPPCLRTRQAPQAVIRRPGSGSRRNYRPGGADSDLAEAVRILTRAPIDHLGRAPALGRLVPAIRCSGNSARPVSDEQRLRPPE
jgi:hypothetical protein